MFWGAKKLKKYFKKYFSNRIEKLHKMTLIIFFFYFLKKLKKVELSPQNFRYDVLHPFYSVCKLRSDWFWAGYFIMIRIEKKPSFDFFLKFASKFRHCVPKELSRPQNALYD